MRRARAMLRKYRGARISVTGSTDISGASSNAAGGGGGGGGGNNNRLNILIQGPDLEQLQAYTVQLMDKVRTIKGVVDVDSNFEPTQPELRIDVNRARAADLGVNIDSLATNLRTLVGGEEVSEYKDGDDQFMVQPATRRAVSQQPPRDGRSPHPGRSGEDRQGQRRRHAHSRARPGVHRPLQPPAPDLGQRQHRSRAARRRHRGGPAEGRGTAPEARLPGDVRRQRQTARRGVEQLHDRDRPGRRVHLHGARLAVQQLRPPADDHDGAAAEPPGRTAGVDGIRDDAQRVQRDRADDAVRHRQEELDPAGRLHEHAPRRRAWSGTRRSLRPTTSACGRF